MNKLTISALLLLFVLSGALLQFAYEARQATKEEEKSHKAQLVALCAAMSDAIRESGNRNIQIATRKIGDPNDIQEIAPYIYVEKKGLETVYTVFNSGKVVIHLRGDRDEEFQEKYWGDFEVFASIGKK